MKLPITFGEDAASEYEAAFQWYHEHAGPETADRLEAEVERTLSLITESPRLFQVVQLPESDLDVRRAPVKGFPYAVVYLALPTELRVISISHLKRRPLHWADRIEDEE